MQVSAQVLAAYRENRRHQMATYHLDGLRVWNDARQEYVSARQFTGGGAPYQCHALAAYWSARRSIHFREDLKARLADHDRRSAAAKKAWKARSAKDAA